MPATSPQYSSMGRMDPEFLGDDYAKEDVEEDIRPIIACGITTRILGVSPTEGQYGTVIKVRLIFKRTYTSEAKVSFRINMGNIPLVTTVFSAPPSCSTAACWELQAVAPDPIKLGIFGEAAPLIVQVRGVQDTHIIDDVCIGGFKFVSSSRLVAHLGYRIPKSSHRAETAGALPQGPPEVHQVPTQDVPGGFNEALSPTMVRNRPPQNYNEGTYQVTLDVHGNLKSMTRNWSDEEDIDNRRLVEFFCARDHGRIDVSFAPVYGENALDTSRNVVSCIWWEEAGDFIITSVDTIGLLEKLVGIRFTTEEKNRIRRNLQVFKPSTISKNQAECESFFRMLMEFPPPRPRNIEKDVKAFSWSKLPSMLNKIISKYWFVTSSAGSGSDEKLSSRHFQVIRDPEGESPTIVGTTFSAASSPSRRSGTLLSSSCHATTPGEKSPSQPEPLEGSAYPDGPGIATHDSPPAYSNSVLMEISEDAMQEVQFLQTASSYPTPYSTIEPYITTFGLSSSDDFYTNNTVTEGDHELSDDL
ncbi:hypothetical protein RhiLY_07439 [Ceratobasidium sp. AG-Ba]|nr:hypothetical protein RhiLY_07439 [Ceratobasidium sp. AG-Ba]